MMILLFFVFTSNLAAQPTSQHQNFAREKREIFTGRPNQNSCSGVLRLIQDTDVVHAIGSTETQIVINRDATLRVRIEGNCCYHVFDRERCRRTHYIATTSETVIRGHRGRISVVKMERSPEVGCHHSLVDVKDLCQQSGEVDQVPLIIPKESEKTTEFKDLERRTTESPEYTTEEILTVQDTTTVNGIFDNKKTVTDGINTDDSKHTTDKIWITQETTERKEIFESTTDNSRQTTEEATKIEGFFDLTTEASKDTTDDTLTTYKTTGKKGIFDTNTEDSEHTTNKILISTQDIFEKEVTTEDMLSTTNDDVLTTHDITTKKVTFYNNELESTTQKQSDKWTTDSNNNTVTKERTKYDIEITTKYKNANNEMDTKEGSGFIENEDVDYFGRPTEKIRNDVETTTIREETTGGFVTMKSTNDIKYTTELPTIKKRTYIAVKVEPKDSIVFNVGERFALLCDAELIDTDTNEIMNNPEDMEFTWKKNGINIMDQQKRHIIFESKGKGNILIYQPTSEDRGLYQCVARFGDKFAKSGIIRVTAAPIRDFASSGRQPKKQKPPAGRESKKLLVYPSEVVQDSQLTSVVLPVS